jgi:hypothetical protein
MRLLLSVVLLCWGCGAGTASGEPVNEAGTVPPYALKRRSVCELSEGARSPFLPVGWTRPTVASLAPAPAPVAAFSEKEFVLTSILLGTPSLAVLNGRAYSEREFLRLPKELHGRGRVQLLEIADGMVVLKAGAQQLTIAQRRADLPVRRRELEVLGEEP